MSNTSNKSRYHENRRLKAELKTAHKLGYEQGSAATLLALYQSVADDLGMPGALWISSRLSGKRTPFNPEIEKLVRADLIRHMRTYDPARAAQVERDFAAYLAGVPL